MTRSLSQDVRLPEGSLVGDYVVRAMLGDGGCAAVYVVEHRRTGARAALKLLRQELAVAPKMLARFAREVEVIRLVSHPGVVRIEAFGQLPDLRPYYVMELLPGATLGAFMRERGRLSAAEALEILGPLCEALDAVHRVGIVHRDVNGANVLLHDEDGRRTVKLIDFGIAKMLAPPPGSEALTTSGRRVGTPGSMAPEQILGQEVDPRADVYALGVLLFRMLTGRFPFQGEKVLDLEMAHLHAPAPRPSQIAPVDRAVEAVVLRCLRKRPTERYPGTLAMLDDLRRAVASGASEGDASGGAAEGARAVGIHVAAHASCDADDDALLDDIAALLDAAEQTLVAAGFEISVQTGNSVLGVRLVAEDLAEARRAREIALQVARAIHGAILERPDADPRVRWLVCAHEDDAVTEGPHVAGGPILRLAGWVPEGRTGAMATRDLLAHLGGSSGRGTSRHVPIRTERDARGRQLSPSDG